MRNVVIERRMLPTNIWKTVYTETVQIEVPTHEAAMEETAKAVLSLLRERHPEEEFRLFSAETRTYREVIG